MKNFLKKNLKVLGKVLLILASLFALSIVAMLILSAFDVVYYDEGLQLNMDLFDNFKNSWYGWLIIILLQVVITTVLCFIPGASMAFIMLLGAIYSVKWQAFLLAFMGVLISSCLMYVMGRIGGYRICRKLLGEEDCNKASNLLNNRGVIFFPIMMLFPIFPDDALVMIAGTLKMSLKWFIPSIVIGRGIGIATIIFGLGSIPFDKFTTPWHWIGFILACAIFIVGILYLANSFSKYMDRKKKAVASFEAVIEATDATEQSGADAEETVSVTEAVELTAGDGTEAEVNADVATEA